MEKIKQWQASLNARLMEVSKRENTQVGSSINNPVQGSIKRGSKPIEAKTVEPEPISFLRRGRSIAFSKEVTLSSSITNVTLFGN